MNRRQKITIQNLLNLILIRIKKLNNIIKTLFIGDVVGAVGIEAVKQYLPLLVEKYKPDFILANGENACEGKGITEVEANLLFSLGIHVLTSGNHIWENWKGKNLLATCPNLIRPFNYPAGNIGKGFLFLKMNNFHKLLF